jgi:hypothetical protein
MGRLETFLGSDEWLDADQTLTGSDRVSIIRYLATAFCHFSQGRGKDSEHGEYGRGRSVRG